MKTFDCPKCQCECHRESVDVGVGIIYGPWGCPECGWSELGEEREAMQAEAGPDRYVDQFGVSHSINHIVERAEHFGLDGDVVREVFKQE